MDKNNEVVVEFVKIDWVRKLTSRKMWMAIASFVSMLLVALGYAEEIATQITALILAGASVLAYIIGEGLVDSANASGKDAADGVPIEVVETVHVNDSDK